MSEMNLTGVLAAAGIVGGAALLLINGLRIAYRYVYGRSGGDGS